jgi:hypothetical protein
LINGLAVDLLVLAVDLLGLAIDLLGLAVDLLGLAVDLLGLDVDLLGGLMLVLAVDLLEGFGRCKVLKLKGASSVGFLFLLMLELEKARIEEERRIVSKNSSSGPLLLYCSIMSILLKQI